MAAKTKRIGEIKRLENRINVWSVVADLAGRIAGFANTRCCVYVDKQSKLIDELSTGLQGVNIEAKKEYNRQHFEFEL